MVDTGDLKSPAYSACRFDSDFGHHKVALSLTPRCPGSAGFFIAPHLTMGLQKGRAVSNNSYHIVYKSSGDGSPAPMTCVQASVSGQGVPFTSISVSAMDGATGKFLGPVVRVVNAPEGSEGEFGGLGYILSDIRAEVMSAFDRAAQHLEVVSQTNPPRSRAQQQGDNTAATPAVARKRTQSFAGVGQGLSRVTKADAQKRGFTMADAIKKGK